MSNQLQKPKVDNDTVVITVLLNKMDGRDAMGVNIVPQQNVGDLWQALAFLMEATGATAASLSKNGNPKSITTYEDMADYVTEYITKVVMSAEPK